MLVEVVVVLVALVLDPVAGLILHVHLFHRGRYHYTAFALEDRLDDCRTLDEVGLEQQYLAGDLD